MENKTNPKFVIKETSDNQFHFVLKARNGRIILSSETYAAKQGAETGIDSVIDCAKYFTNFELKNSVDGQHYFILKANNGKTIGMSETYKTYANAINGVRSVIRNSIVISER